MNAGFLNRESLRLLAEILIIVGVAEAAVMMVLPVLAPNASDTMETVLDAGLLTLICAPLLLWRFLRLAPGASGVQPQAATTTNLPGTLQRTGLRAWLWPAVALAIGASLTVAATWSVHHKVRADANAAFAMQVDRLVQDIEDRFTTPVHALNGMVGFYNASDAVARPDFDAFWEFRDINTEFPGIRSFGFIQPIARTDMARFEAAERADGAPEYTVKTKGNDPELFVVRHMVSNMGSRSALGIDINVEANRRAAISKAITSGKTVLSRMLQLTIQPGVTQPGFLMLQPVYRRGTEPLNPNQRTAVISGLVYAAMVVDDLMVQPMAATHGLLAFAVAETAPDGASVPIFESNATALKTTHGYENSRVLVVHGHTLAIRATSSPAFDASQNSSRAPLAAALGTLISLFAAAGIWALPQGRALAERRALVMSAENKRMATVVHSTNNAVVIANPQGDIEWTNPAFARITGFTFEEAKGQKLLDLRNTQNADPVAYATMQYALQNGQDVRLQVHHTQRNGEDYWVDADIQILRDTAGAPSSIVAVETDITAEKRAAETLGMALMETAALMTTVTTHSIVSEADRAGNITSINHAFEAISGYSREELIGANHRIVNSGTHPPEFWDAMWFTIASGKSWRGEVCNRAKDGHLYWVDTVIAPFINAEGEITKFVSIRNDITATKTYQTELQAARAVAEEAARSKGQFLANMSHEIRTPMNAILGMLTLLQKTPLDDRQADYASKTEGAARSLLGLLNDILDFSKVEAGKMDLDVQPFRVDRLLRDLSVVLSANLGNKPVEVLFDIDPAVPDVLRGDTLRLQQILINLGGNAVKFTAQGQVVISIGTVAADATMGVPPNTLRFAVKDSGIGIAPENQHKIFSGFSQAEASTSRRFGGTGLGLAISQRLVAIMGGTLQLESALGEGSTFSFTVVLPEVAEPPPELQLAPRPSTPPKRVLVVDDNTVAGPLTVRMVQSWGWRAQWVASGEAALALLHAQADALAFDVIFVDWLMPGGMDGWETTRQIRARCQTLGATPSIVMVASQGREALAQRTQEEQNLLNGYLVKPVTASMLFDAVVDAPAARSALRQNGRGASQRRLAGMRVLVVEDNLINQQVAEELLNAEGAMVSLAANGQLGVDAVLAANPQFDVVLMDVQMPVLDGYAATRVLRTTHHITDLPIIAMTANAMRTDRDACIEAGMDDHIGKPFDLNQLVALLKRMTGHSAAPQPDVAEEPSLPAALPPTPGVDLAQALARLGGMRALYLRSARDFVAVLPTVVPLLEATLQAGDLAQAAMHLHTVKGNAGTLGLQTLADEAGTLEKWCKQPGADTDSATRVGLHADMQPRIAALGTTAQTSLAALSHAIAALETAMGTGAPAAGGAATGAPIDADAAAVTSALTELQALLEANDLGALERFATLRPVLATAYAERLDPLEYALQGLELEEALQCCLALKNG